MTSSAGKGGDAVTAEALVLTLGGGRTGGYLQELCTTGFQPPYTTGDILFPFWSLG